MKIANREIGPNHPPYIIAELSGNHNQSLDRALALVEAASQGLQEGANGQGARHGELSKHLRSAGFSSAAS